MDVARSTPGIMTTVAISVSFNLPQHVAVSVFIICLVNPLVYQSY